MQKLVVLVASVLGYMCVSCGVAEGVRGWNVMGELRDAATGESLPGADVTVRLFRAGEPLNESAFSDGTVVTAADGKFEAFVFDGRWGVVLFLNVALASPPASTDDPPDSAEIVVRTATAEGTILIPIDPSAITSLSAVTGEIQFSILSVELIPVSESVSPATGGRR